MLELNSKSLDQKGKQENGPQDKPTKITTARNEKWEGKKKGQKRKTAITDKKQYLKPAGITTLNIASSFLFEYF